MTRVLCVCVGNISRSPMMQVLLQEQLGAGFVVESAGLQEDLAGRGANHRSVACMAERGLDLSGHTSRWIGTLDLGRYRWIVCVGSKEAEEVRAMGGADPARVLVANEADGGVPDPYELGMEGYRECVTLLERVMPDIARVIAPNSPPDRDRDRP